MFAHTPGKVFNGDTGDVACDHYHRYKEDVALMRSVGLKGYRLSISWPRVLPTGVGSVNEAGLSFYDRLVDELLKNGIEPYVTLFHWDFPLELYYQGSWLNRDSVNWFADYAGIMARRLGDRVHNWMTFNEPAVFTVLGYMEGIHAPGDRMNRAAGLRVAHHVLVAHGLASQAMRAAQPTGTRIGIASNGAAVIPQSESDADIDAARTAMFNNPQTTLWDHAWWCDPIMFGRYPDQFLAEVEAEMPAWLPERSADHSSAVRFLRLERLSRRIRSNRRQRRTRHRGCPDWSRPDAVPLARHAGSALLGGAFPARALSSARDRHRKRPVEPGLGA